MQQSHGIGYEEYSRKLELRLKVEKQREEEFAKSRRVVAKAEQGKL